MRGLRFHSMQADVAGVAFDFVVMRQVIDAVEQWRRARSRNYIVLTNPHSVMLCRRDEQMRRATLSAGLTLPDGVGVVLAAELLGYGRQHRVTGPALMLDVCDRGREIGLRHFFYGGAEGVAEELARRLTAQFPGMIVAGTCCPPFRQLSESEDAQIIDRINEARADIVWVGLGAPKQEKWMRDHLGEIAAPAMIGVGAAFDFHSGNVKWAPKWIRKCGIEWAYRLACEPRRMWRRNLDSPLFLMHVLMQAAGNRLRALLHRAPQPLQQPPAAEMSSALSDESVALDLHDREEVLVG
jgi:N-acetylglucosaminyldiphosphoundecaprenol N-acetyl-beta-D-mannosaminyltransferase